MAISRRGLLLGGAAVGAGVAAGNLGGLTAFAAPPVKDNKYGEKFGTLVPVAGGRIAVPAGFSASVVSEVGKTPLLDRPGGSPIGTTPGNLDGTGCFPCGSELRLVRNHELKPGAKNAVPHVKGTVYDPGAPMGGCTVIQTSREGKNLGEWVGLSGTFRNCAGGQTPWDSWLSCEEDTTKKGPYKAEDGKEYVLQKDHGYVFEVFPAGPDRQIPEPIIAWGRGVFEGAAIDPKCDKAYITEDTGDGLFYRWTAPSGKKLKAGIAKDFGPGDGVLEALAVLREDGKAYAHYAEMTAADLNKPKKTKWVKPSVDDRQAQKTDLRKQFEGVTRHPKIEGCWSDGKVLWFTCSYANKKEADRVAAADAKYPAKITVNQGMVFCYDFKEQTITLKIYYAVGDRFDGPDNITVSPYGTITIAEDGEPANHLISWTPGLGSQAIAENLVDGGETEWAGPVWSPKGEVLFGSVQDSCTYAITGPWKKCLNGR